MNRAEYLRKSKERAKIERKHNYLVGFIGAKQCVYGQDKFATQFNTKVAGYTSPMTILQAIRQLKTLNGEKAIYKLVKVDPQEEKFKRKIISQMVKKD